MSWSREANSIGCSAVSSQKPEEVLLDAIVSDLGPHEPVCRCTACLLDAIEATGESGEPYIDRDDPVYRHALRAAMTAFRERELRDRARLLDAAACYLFAGRWPRSGRQATARRAR